MFARRSLPQLRKLFARCEDVSDLPRRTGGKCVNNVQLIGYTGSDPQRGGTEVSSVTKFRLATTAYYQSRDDKPQSKTQWHNVLVFKPYLQDLVNSYIRKGTRLYVQGSIEYSNYVDQEGIKRFSSAIVSNDIIILNRPNTQSEGFDEYPTDYV